MVDDKFDSPQIRDNAMFDDTHLAPARPDRLLGAGCKQTTVAEGAYGDRVARCFRLQHAPWMVSTSLSASQFAATSVVIPNGMTGFCEAVQPERGFIFHVYLNGAERWETWREGKKVSSQRYEKGSISVHDLRHNVRWLVEGPIDLLSLYLPLDALNEVADEIGGTHIEELMPSGDGSDPVLTGLGTAVLQVLQHPGRLNQLFFDQLALAIGTHVLRHYGGIQERMQRTRGALSAAQEHRAKQLLADRLDGGLSMAEIAKACGLSRAHFSASFRRGTGLTPHAWLTQYRVQKVKQLLRSSSRSIADVALTCGFADQSHLTRVFSRFTGCAPAAWRREFGTAASVKEGVTSTRAIWKKHTRVL